MLAFNPICFGDQCDCFGRQNVGALSAAWGFQDSAKTCQQLQSNSASAMLAAGKYVIGVQRFFRVRGDLALRR